MKYQFTPEEAQSVADAVAGHFRRKSYRVSVEVPLKSGAPYRSTLLARKVRRPVVLVEAQGRPDYSPSIQSLVHWLAAERAYSETYLATHDESLMRSGLLNDLNREGVGLLLVGTSGEVSVSRKARNPALVVTPDPTLSFGPCKREAFDCLDKFNTESRKDGLRDMCELVERETERLAVALARKGWISFDQSAVQAMSWSDQINALASLKNYSPGRTPIVSSDLKQDLHSFRGARNLFDHKVRSVSEELRRERQYAERMMMGPRLLAELVSLQKRVR